MPPDYYRTFLAFLRKGLRLGHKRIKVHEYWALKLYRMLVYGACGLWEERVQGRDRQEGDIPEALLKAKLKKENDWN